MRDDDAWIDESPSGVRVTRRAVNHALLATAFAVVRAPAHAQPTHVHLFDFAIAGGGYHGLAAVADRLIPGVAFRLVREPANPFDACAVAVYFETTRVGYIPREANAPIADLLDRGETLSAQTIGRLDVRRAIDIPNDLVCTDFMSGDPLVRLSRSNR